MADEELVSFLVSQGHSEERAEQIATNHPDAVRADLKAKATLPQEERKPNSAPSDLAAIRNFLDHEFENLHDRIAALEARHERLVDHVNREVGVSGDAPLVDRILALETAQPKAVTPQEQTAISPTS